MRNLVVAMTRNEKIDNLVSRARGYWLQDRKTEAFELLIRELLKLKTKVK